MGPYLENLERWTRPGVDGVDFDVALVVAPDQDPSQALQWVREYLDQGQRVLLIMEGALAPETVALLPPNLAVTLRELEAYMPQDALALRREFLSQLQAWLGQLFAGALKGVDPSKAFWVSAQERLGTLAVLEGFCLAQGILVHHPQIEFRVFGDRQRLHHRIFMSQLPCSGRPAAPSRWRRSLFQLKFLLAGSIAAVGTVALRLSEFRREQRVRNFIRRHQSKQTASDSPALWACIIGHWEFSCRHIVGPIGDYARQHKKLIGVLLQSSLNAGDFENGWRQSTGSGRLLPALNSPYLKDTWRSLDQIVSYPDWPSYFKSIPGNLARMLGSVGRAAIQVPTLKHPRFELPLIEQTWALAKLTTLDVWRAREAQFATHAFAKRNPINGAKIVFGHASLVSDAVPDLTLQSLGGITFDVTHGGLTEVFDYFTTSRTFSRHKIMWTRRESDFLGPLWDTNVIGPVPARAWARRGQRKSLSHPVRLLILSNYATQLSRPDMRRIPRVGFQGHLLAAVQNACRRLPEEFSIVWRPHPGDNPGWVARDASAWGPLSLSQGSQLAEDIEWADLVIGTPSTTLIEVLAWDKPLLVHDVPFHDREQVLNAFCKSRRFSNATQLEATLKLALQDTLNPEAEARRRLFGETEGTKLLGEVLFNL